MEELDLTMLDVDQTFLWEDYFHGEGQALTVFETERLVRGFVGEVYETWDTPPPEMHAYLLARSTRLENILYGREPGYTYGNWNSPEGLGAHLARRIGEIEPAEIVERVLMTLALRLRQLAVPATFEADAERQIALALDLLTGGVPGPYHKAP